LHKYIGTRFPRKEDDRFLRGRGQYIGDLRFSGMRDAAFVRSPVAHARIVAIRVPEHLRGQVFTAKDLAGVKPIRAVSPLPGFQVSEQPPLAAGKVRQVGELIAMCVAETRAEAEDIAAQVAVDYDELPAVYRSHDLFAFPSLSETFGHPLTEAMSTGTPIVAADTAVHREVCKDAAVYHSPLSASDLARQICRLNADEGLRRSLIEKGVTYVASDYMWEAHVDRLLDIFGQVMAKR